jgi:5'-nucleotidase
MHILLTNDDGIFAAGLAVMYKRLSKLGHVTVVAPSSVQSGAGHSISLREITCCKLDILGLFTGYSVDGTPADCVKLAVNEIAKSEDPFDLVVSGINYGANVGINVFYSGTVAGAIEAAFYNLPAIAVSAAMDEPWLVDAAGDWVMKVISQLLPLKPRQVINLNIPQLSKRPPQGIKIVTQSTSGFEESFQVLNDLDGKSMYRLTGGNHRDQDFQNQWTDVMAIEAGYITLTSLRLDLTEPAGNDILKQKNIQLK